MHTHITGIANPWHSVKKNVMLRWNQLETQVYAEIIDGFISSIQQNRRLHPHIKTDLTNWLSG